MMDAKVVSRLFRDALRSHIRQTGSIEAVAERMGIGRSTVYHFLSGWADTGFERAFEMAQSAGLLPVSWIKKTGLLPQHGGYSASLRRELGLLDQPKDKLLLKCARLASKVKSGSSLTQPEVPESILACEELYQSDPEASEALVSQRLKNSLRLVRTMMGGDEVAPGVLIEFHMLVALYGTYRYLKSEPNECAWSIAFALQFFESMPDSQPLTWLLCDASMILRRLFKIEQASALAEAAVGKASSQDTSRLLPRAWLSQAAILFYKGEYRQAADVYALVVNTVERNIYQPLAAYSEATALERIEPKRAARVLAQRSKILDDLPAHRQMQRFWTQGRILRNLGSEEEAFSSFVAAIRAGATCDTRDLFLVFEEARALVGSDDKRLLPLASKLSEELPKLSFQYPDEFLAANQYLKFLGDRDEQGLKKKIAIMSGKSDDEAG